MSAKSDEEVICGFIEPKPPVADQQHAETMDLCGSGLKSPLGFWWCTGGYDEPYRWRPRPLTLDGLHEVEIRLMMAQRKQYESLILADDPDVFDLLHTTARQKIKALAAVLRGEKP
jgi:hypothetical protein